MEGWGLGQATDMRIDGMEAVDLGGVRIWHGRVTARNEVSKLNCFIVAGLFYFI